MQKKIIKDFYLGTTQEALKTSFQRKVIDRIRAARNYNLSLREIPEASSKDLEEATEYLTPEVFPFISSFYQTARAIYEAHIVEYQDSDCEPYLEYLGVMKPYINPIVYEVIIELLNDE